MKNLMLIYSQMVNTEFAQGAYMCHSVYNYVKSQVHTSPMEKKIPIL